MILYARCAAQLRAEFDDLVEEGALPAGLERGRCGGAAAGSHGDLAFNPAPVAA